MQKMKAAEVLRRYAAGERNFQGVNIRGQSFKDQDLSGADFSEADIQSTNFAGAILRGTKFCGAKCGLQRRWVTILVIVVWLTSFLSGIVSHASVYFAAVAFDFQKYGSNIAGITTLTMLIGFFVFTTQRGLVVGFVAAFTTGILSATVAGALTVFKNVIPILTAGAIAAAGFSFVVTIGAIVVITVAGIAWTTSFIIAKSRALAVTFSILGTIIFTWASAGFGVEGVINKLTESGNVTTRSNIAIAIACALTTALISVYIGSDSFKVDSRESWIRSIAIAFAAMGGTSFRGADLTEANFTKAKLKNTDLRKAQLTRVRWYKTKMLERTRPGNSYLQYSQVRQWLIGKGTDKNFDSQKLRGINLQGANLADASFIGSDLSDANLKDTDLSKAKLVQTLLGGTNFSGATLTGAVIEDWGINNQTKINDVICDYIYLKEGQQERLPHNPKRIFKLGEFAQYVEKALNTVDLIFTDGIDWKAFLASLENLQDEYGEDNIVVQAIERKSGDCFVVRIEVPPDVDKAKLENQAKQIYENEIRTLENKYREKLQAKEEQIAIYRQHNTDLMEIIKLKANQPIQNIIDITNTAESTSMSETYESKYNFKHSPVGGIVDRAESGSNPQFTQNNYNLSEEKRTLAEAAEEIQKLLKQLQ